MEEQDVVGPDASEYLQAQLEGELRAETRRALAGRRPVLTHLNADTTWLLSLPVPGGEGEGKDQILRDGRRTREDGKDVEMVDEDSDDKVEEERERKAFFHILIDPWLRGSQSDVAQFFSQQWHAHDSACQTISEVEDAIRGIEAAASSATPSPSPPRSQSEASPIDAVVISHEFTDHMHKDTLLEVAPSVPVFASSKAASIIKSWRHFTSVQALQSLTPRATDWHATSVPPLPPWLGIGRLAKDGVDLLYYHSAVLITFSSSPDGSVPPEAVVYTPHGITPEDLTPLANSEPAIRTLALLHGLHDVSLSAGQLNLGAHNGLRAQRITKARYWVGTHDEVKKGGGLVSWFLKREVLSVKEALEKEAGGSGSGEIEDMTFVDIPNGESIVLA